MSKPIMTGGIDGFRRGKVWRQPQIHRRASTHPTTRATLAPKAGRAESGPRAGASRARRSADSGRAFGPGLPQVRQTAGNGRVEPEACPVSSRLETSAFLHRVFKAWPDKTWLVFMRDLTIFVPALNAQCRITWTSQISVTNITGS
ncbi:MAG: hypothetical protein GY862_39090 [Gammaproteobacteria bacterium]|nr:hypothetical protein [Gammaproteobacteria bacterium]